MSILRRLLAIFPLLLLVGNSVYFAWRGNYFIAAMWGTIAVALVLYALFPYSSMTREAFRDRSAQRRTSESEACYHLRVAGYWGHAAIACVALFFTGGWASEVVPTEVAQHGIWGAVFYFCAPLLAATFALKGVGSLWRAFRSRKRSGQGR